MNCLNFKNIPEFLEIFEQIKDMWCCQEIVSSIKTPKYLIWSFWQTSRWVLNTFASKTVSANFDILPGLFFYTRLNFGIRKNIAPISSFVYNSRENKKTPWGYMTKFNTRRLRPRSNPLPFYISFWQKKDPFYIPFIEKRYPFHIPSSENCTPFVSPYNEVNEQYHRKISSIIRRNALQTTSVIYSLHAVKLPFYIPQLVKSLPFYIPKAWKRYPFRVEPPSIGQYRKYPPPPSQEKKTKTPTRFLSYIT